MAHIFSAASQSGSRHCAILYTLPPLSFPFVYIFITSRVAFGFDGPLKHSSTLFSHRSSVLEALVHLCHLCVIGWKIASPHTPRARQVDITYNHGIMIWKNRKIGSPLLGPSWCSWYTRNILHQLVVLLLFLFRLPTLTSSSLLPTILPS
jgi:hypothetical protein